jgi:hypothetical protein
MTINCVKCGKSVIDGNDNNMEVYYSNTITLTSFITSGSQKRGQKQITNTTMPTIAQVPICPSVFDGPV